MRALGLAVGLLSVSVMAQTAPVQMIKEDAAPPGVLVGATADTLVVSQNVLRALAVSEPDIVAPEGAPPGTVWLKVLVSKTGAVEEAVVSQGDAALGQAAIDGVKRWTYRPFLVDGEPREIQSMILLDFRDGVGKRAAMAGLGVRPGGTGELGQGAVTANGLVGVSSGIVAGLLDHAVAPVYPPIAKAAHVQGVVVLRAILSKEGDIESLEVISGPPLLRQAAMDAVQRWKYRPYVLNGVPTEVRTTINVNFTFAAPKKPDAVGGATGDSSGTTPAATPDPK